MVTNRMRNFTPRVKYSFSCMSLATSPAVSPKQTRRPSCSEQQLLNLFSFDHQHNLDNEFNDESRFTAVIVVLHKMYKIRCDGKK